jgi:hypothetical protein
MSWTDRQEVLEQLPPEVAHFVVEALRSIEQENVCDAPGVISGVLHRMQRADSPTLRYAIPLTESLLRRAFSPARAKLFSA